ncbi:DUF6776 family protein [Xanthomonas theicola]|uniref:Uncharacterized protein n=1 Tax=Xanthomonas theicola TaxID=56464 RepID=A0A2S6ZEC3_9XANT|nr:DUF6776 family protein [Xanthomonas theicola]PPT90500.1 hypothetical protein XthCFBP4691_12070 [Xanthomonas theicola]QNH26685.1 hypothetical protein G4Q83_20910 [Xanthomonas theicola]
MNRPIPRFQIVPNGAAPRRGRGLWLLIGAAWLLSLGAAWALASRQAAPQLGAVSARLRESERQVQAQQQQIETLNQRQATLARSDQISRAANNEVQSSLAERDEEIAGLRADVAFYERLVGATGQRKGLTVHSVEFSAEAGGTWHYNVVLTQNLNRGAISRGQLRLAVEGVRGGKLASVGWDELHQKSGVPGQDYSFRYFQQLHGSVILPKDFTPQRVRVSLSGGGAPVAQSFDWTLAGNG